MTTTDRPKHSFIDVLLFSSLFLAYRHGETRGGNVNTALLTAAAAAAFGLCFVYKIAVNAPAGRSTGTDFDGIGLGRCCSCFLGMACVEFVS